MRDPQKFRNELDAGRKSAGRGVIALASVLLFVVIVGGLASFAFLRPTYYWDMLGYAAVIESWHTSDAAAIHREAYSSIHGLPEYPALIGTQPPSDFNHDVFRNSIDFVQQISFYSIKPLYCLGASALHRMGLSYPRALGFLSLFPFVCLAMLTWFWFRRYLDEWECALFGALLVVSPPIYAISRFATPDALGLTLVAVALYLLLESSRIVVGCALLLIGIWVRPDALILAGLLFCVLLFLKKIDLMEWGTFCLLALTSYGVIQIFAGPYSWSVLFHNSFVAALKEAGNAVVHVTPRLYFFTVARNGWTLVRSSSITLVIFMGVLALLLHRRRAYRYITATVLVSEIIHFLLFPSLEHRFYALPTFFAPLSLVLACSGYFLKSSARLENQAESS